MHRIFQNCILDPWFKTRNMSVGQTVPTSQSYIVPDKLAHTYICTDAAGVKLEYPSMKILVHTNHVVRISMMYTDMH